MANMNVQVQPAFITVFKYDLDTLEQLPFTEDLTGPSKVHYDFQALASDPAFYNAAEQMMLVHTFATLWRVRIGERIARIQKMLDKATP